jgi:hypothetical protein
MVIKDTNTMKQYKFPAMFVSALVAGILASTLLLACTDLWGPMDDPADPQSPTYQGYPVVAGANEITLVSNWDGNGEPVFTCSKINGATSYQLQVSADEGFGTTVYDKPLTTNTIIAADLLDRLNHETQYWWRMGVYSGEGIVWSTSRSFISPSRILPAPEISLASGEYQNDQTIEFRSDQTGVHFIYTTDGTDPSELNGDVYGGPFLISTAQTIKVIAAKDGWGNSAVADGTYSFRCATPVISERSLYQMVIFSSDTNDALIRYTTNGTTPTSTTGMVYSEPITVASTQTVRAVAFRDGWEASEMASRSFTLLGTVPNPTFSPVAGTYTSVRSVSISAGTGATILYTDNGTTPNEDAGTIYTGPVTVSSSHTIRAIAYRTGYAASSISSAAYVITGTVASPQFDLAAGTYTGYQTVSLSTSTTDALIRYTIDGTTPTSTSGLLYTTPITVASSQTVRAIAYKSGWTNSSVTSATYTIVVEAPVISIAEGTYTSAQVVTISTGTSGASIRYTTNGTNPTSTTGTVYSVPITVSSTQTVKAIAYKTGLSNSVIASASYVITGTVATPTFSPAAGTYTTGQSVTISSGTSGASIRYTTDGSIPSKTNGTLYSTPVAVLASQTIQAIAYKTDWADSAVGSAEYVITGTVADPVFDLAAGTYTTSQTVSISSSTPDASIRYTIDGSTPTSTSGTLYSDPVTVANSQTIKAIAYKLGWDNSSISSVSYVITGTVATPTFSPAAGTYTTGQSVSISSGTSGASIRYTTDGSTPSKTTGTLFSSPVTVSTSQTIRAIAYKTDWDDSAVASAEYVITGTVANPVFNPAGGTYTSAQTVTISSSTPDASIRYTVDGSTPTSTAGLVYSTPITVDSNQTVKAIAYKTSWADSAVASATYAIAVEAPVFSVVAGTYTTAQAVTLSTGTSGASIRYTTNGTNPTSTTGTLYSAPITVSSTQTVKAIAYKIGLSNSVIASASYVITGTVATPTFSPAAGTYTTGQAVTISSGTSGASIRYTTDGSDPSKTTGTLFSSPVTVSASQTIRAIAYKTDWNDSAVGSAEYVITGTVADPVFNPAGGTYTSAQTVTISSSTPDASIRYTVDGSTPTSTAGLVYSTPITVDSNQTVKAIAYKTSWANSAVVSVSYVINPIVPPPVPLLPENMTVIDDTTPTLTWSSILGSTGYRIQLASDNLFELLVADISPLMSTSYTHMIVLDRAATYWWRVAVKSSDDAWSAWTDASSFTYMLPPPPPPMLTPANGTSVPTARPTLTWVAVDGAASYELSLAQSGAGLVTATPIEVIGTSWTPTTTLTAGTWYWKVRGVHAWGNYGDWGLVWSFSSPYTVGDTGPAGGIVFYDKGSYSDGWRYLEAWTDDEPGTFMWKTDDTYTNPSSTSTAIGGGYANTYTALLDWKHYAAGNCRSASHGGYTDWFLPSRDELYLMFEQKEVIGNFTEGDYWSSSIANYGSGVPHGFAYFTRFNEAIQSYNAPWTIQKLLRAARYF